MYSSTNLLINANTVNICLDKKIKRSSWSSICEMWTPAYLQLTERVNWLLEIAMIAITHYSSWHCLPAPAHYTAVWYYYTTNIRLVS